jgi:hypothetical protein
MQDSDPLNPVTVVTSDRREIVRLEKNLNSFGFFTPSHKRLSSLDEKIVRIFVRESGGQRVEAKATILPSAKLGLPITADQDKYYAFQRIMEEDLREKGQISNPVSFTSARMLKELGLKRSGKHYREIADWLERMTLTGIRSEGAVYFAGRKKYGRDTFTVFTRSVTIGQEMPDGQVADKNYVWLSEWQLENLNSGYVLPVDYEVYRSLHFNISKALIPLLQVWFYAARSKPIVCVEKRYSELCGILSIRRWAHLSKIRQILAPSLDELQGLKVLKYWDIEKTADGADFKIILGPGERFLTEHRMRLNGKTASEILDVRSQHILKALLDRGVIEEKARRMLLDLPTDQPVLDQLEWGDFEIARRAATREKIQNPPGFYIYLLETNCRVPNDFETSRKRQAREIVQKQKQDAAAIEAQRQLRQMLLDEQYANYYSAEYEKYINTRMDAQDLEKRLRTARAVVRKSWGVNLSEASLEYYARQHLYEQLAGEVKLMSFEEFSRQNQLTLPL